MGPCCRELEVLKGPGLSRGPCYLVFVSFRGLGQSGCPGSRLSTNARTSCFWIARASRWSVLEGPGLPGDQLLQGPAQLGTPSAGAMRYQGPRASGSWEGAPEGLSAMLCQGPRLLGAPFFYL